MVQSMTDQVEAQVTIDIPQAEAWEKLRDLSLAANYVPGLVKVELSTPQSTGVGASRKVYQAGGRYIDETVEEWRDGEGFLLRLHHGDKPAAPFKRAWFRYDLATLDAAHTRFTASLIYELPWGGLGRVVNKLLLRRIMRKVIEDVALAMKLYYESGEPTTPDKLKQYKATH
jgi:hypothetical protein